MQLNVLNDLAKAKRRWTEKNEDCCEPVFFCLTPAGSRQVVYQAGKTIALCKFTELMQWQHWS